MVQKLDRSGRESGDPVRLDFLDPAIQFGAAGAYETIRVEAGRLHLWAAHAERLKRALEFLGLSAPLPMEALRAALAPELALHPPDDPLRLRITVGYDPLAPPEGPGADALRIFVEARPIEAARRGPVHGRPPMSLAVFRDYSLFSGDAWRAHKTTQHYPMWEARRRVARLGFQEGLLLNERGEVAEACAHNVFWIVGDELRTPAASAGGLPGTFAAWIRRAAGELGLAVRMMQAEPEALRDADAVFLTNAISEVLGVSRLEDREFGSLAENGVGRILLDCVERRRAERADAEPATLEMPSSGGRR